MNRLGDHSADYWSRDWLHPVGADATLPQNGRQAEHYDGNCHELPSKPLDCALMGESDPYLIEVKASKKLDRRGKRQMRSLERLRTFHETDKGEGLRGFPEVRRQAYEMPERTHVDQMNECIAKAVRNGSAIRQPECGLYYIVATQKGTGPDHVIGSLDVTAPWEFFLNQPKLDRAWAPYLPLTLTIERKDDLSGPRGKLKLLKRGAFIRGKLFLLVLSNWRRHVRSP